MYYFPDMHSTFKSLFSLQDMNEVAFDKFLKFVYTGKQDVLGDDIPEMLRMAAIFQVIELNLDQKGEGASQLIMCS